MQLELLIPLVAILGGIPLAGFTAWLDFKSKQRELGASTDELEKTVNALREALNASEEKRERLTQRVQNLETIVTSESWDALHEAAGQRSLDGGTADETPAQAGDPAQTERLARRVRQQ